MIKKVYFISLVLLLGGLTLRAQNLFTAGANGTFEAPGCEPPGCEQVFTNYNTSNQYTSPFLVSFTRANIFHTGSHSLQIIQKRRTTPGSDSYLYLPFSASVNFSVSMWVYVPRSENPDLGASGGFTNLRVNSYYPPTGGTSNCYANYYVIPSDTWVNVIVSGLKNVAFSLGRDFDDTQNSVTYYVDDIQVLSNIPIDPRPQFGEYSITVNPTGGAVVLTNPTEYTFRWWDDESTSPTRNNLTQGQIYTLTIEQRRCASGVYKFIIGRPATPVANDVSICQNTGTTLTASGAAQPYHGYSWYDALEGGNRLGQSSSLSVGPFATPGIYKYYVQVDIIGDVQGLPSFRKEVVVTVTPTPDPQVTVSSTMLYRGRELAISALNHQPDYQYNYKFTYTSGSNTYVDPFSNSTGQLQYTFRDFDPYQAAGFHPVSVVVTDQHNCSKTFSYNIEVKNYQPLCETIIPTGEGEIKLDKFSGQIVFRRGTLCTTNINLGCIQGKVDAPQLDNVVSASATTYSDKWNYDDALYATAFTQTNPYENGRRGKWRPEATYAFNTGGITFDKNYNSGMFKLRHFNWQFPKSSKRMGWIEANHVDKYSPNGDAIEEHNALGISSAAKFGYGGAVPYLIAQNADYNSVLFESFEYLMNAKFEDGFAFNAGAGMQISSVAHSGTASIRMGAGANVPIRNFTVSPQIKSKGLMVKVWVKDAPASALDLMVNTLAIDFMPVKRTGEWMLYQALVPPDGLTSLQTVSLSIKNQSLVPVFIDDVRIQPQDAEMTGYVYEAKTLRLIAVFDDQHFGLYYQYNSEGKLIRKIIETERGLKTLQETQYNTAVKVN